MLLLAGEYDVGLPPRTAAEYTGLFEHAELAVQPGAGHFPCLDDPAWFTRTLVAFQHLVAAYPQAERIYLIQDNWPVYRHPDLVVGLAPQESPFPTYPSVNWPTVPHARAIERWGKRQLPIQLVPLPTMLPGRTPLRSSGANANRISWICTSSPMTFRACGLRSMSSLPSLLLGRRTYSALSDSLRRMNCSISIRRERVAVW